MYLKEFVKTILPLNLTLEQIEPILQNLVCRPIDYYKATKGTIYHNQWPRYVRGSVGWTLMILKVGDAAIPFVPWDKLTMTDWARILCHKPQYGCYCFKFEKFTAKQWVELLRKHPQFIDKCCWYKFDYRYWLLLIHERDHFLQYYHLFEQSRDQHQIYRLSCMTKYDKMIELKRQKALESDRFMSDQQADEIALEQIRQEQVKYLRPETRTLDI